MPHLIWPLRDAFVYFLPLLCLFVCWCEWFSLDAKWKREIWFNYTTIALKTPFCSLCQASSSLREVSETKFAPRFNYRSLREVLFFLELTLMHKIRASSFSTSMSTISRTYWTRKLQNSFHQLLSLGERVTFLTGEMGEPHRLWSRPMKKWRQHQKTGWRLCLSGFHLPLWWAQQEGHLLSEVLQLHHVWLQGQVRFSWGGEGIHSLPPTSATLPFSHLWLLCISKWLEPRVEKG